MHESIDTTLRQSGGLRTVRNDQPGPHIHGSCSTWARLLFHRA